MIRAKNIYFIGIGGSGMAPIALWLKSCGYNVSGCDISESNTVKSLRENGIWVQTGHNINDKLENSDLVVYSSAVKNNSEDFLFAVNSGKQTIKRAKMLAMMMSEAKNSIAVAGSAGKTSTSGFMACVLNAAKKEPSVIIGGVFAGKSSGMQVGKDEYFVAEADEYDRSFLEIKNMRLAICTGIEAEHLDVFENIEGVKDGFLQFFSGVSNGGVCVLCWDNDCIREIYSEIDKRKVSFGLTEGADYRAENIRYENEKTIFSVSKNGDFLGNVELQLIGLHNVLNALAAIVGGMELGIDFETAARGVGEFNGIKRRIEKVADINGIALYNDYAHHPTKISATLSALKNILPENGRIITIFQPHTFSRTRDFAKEFAEALENGSDFVLMTEIYAAREKPIAGISEASIAKFFKKENSRVVSKSSVVKECAKIARSGDMVVVMSAGDIDDEIESLITELKNGKE